MGRIDRKYDFPVFDVNMVEWPIFVVFGRSDINTFAKTGDEVGRLHPV